MWILLLIQSVFSFTLVDDNAGFKTNSIKIYFTETSCTGAGLSRSELKTLTQDALEDFWEKVSTSSLEFDISGTKNIDVEGLTDFNDIIVQAPSNSILVTCSNDLSAFADGGGTLGVGSMYCSGSTCRGALVINAHSTSMVPNLNRSDLVATMAHELGHALGLGHSEYKHNLMYYSIGGKTQKYLGQDDIDGITYLYPQDGELMGLMGSCGTVGHQGMIPSFLSGFGFLFLFKRKRKNSKINK